ncbi:uncharacterized protein LOC131023241 isoform X2 [Salvia miltiorrhiza]|uniref:uncharacterized protein LOC131023241 isoform X2 n=1 Tax=Salvia miltiorrhiza TaxID=226208 RepID=UPI0025AD10DD|nr:uncharacterized protein LOC131023241 isoform X2 [Salvia miltiorrhiza]XP_057808797.1 uncharacterized protein LOC131023241 isoform X2 [Salvia miltiorrhiza]XP_057808802.1 uncharacterized protein LOC131023241 isoform X2 [Salvia miltiorrhiza]XP_057808804.1 uncharacterized protein LOC131023241 isoform X2 [Salvia miltiorrhiza]XP_057808809.1 uncharacterized protein LOC131023241 isoform X2 [Salvia miltiorrhiza]
MSRCFPFPPPGYELKGTPDDVNLIIKEKQKHKKHKDKKEKKEKKEKSERKDKERGEDKHKDKKDKKRKREKHRDKKDKNKDKPSSSAERKLVGPLENQNDQKLVPDSKPTIRIQDERSVVELGNRVKNDGAKGTQMVQKITILEKEKANLLGKVQENGNGRLAIKDPRDHSRTANGQSLQVDMRSLGNGRNSYGENQIKVEEGKERTGYGNMVAGGGDASRKADQNKNTKAEDKKGKKEKKRELTGFRKDEVKQETSNSSFLEFHSNIPSDLLKENNDCQGKLPKLKELNGFLHAKDNGVRPNNMSRHTIASHQVGSGFRPCQNTISIGVVGKRAVVTDQKVNGKLSSPQSVIDSVRNVGPCQTAADNTKTENGRVNINARVVSNGVISPHIVRIQRKMEPCHTSSSVAMAKQIANNGKAPPSHPLVENGGKMAVQTPDAIHETRVNGSLEGKKHSSSSLKRKEKVTTTTTTRPPHPDMKYLSEILTVPEVEWAQSDDQEWLFECQESETKRPRLATPETKQVWSEAVHLESADVTALPYVIPY